MNDPKQGLSSAEAAHRLTQVGENRLRGKPPQSVAAMFFSQFKDVMILILSLIHISTRSHSAPEKRGKSSLWRATHPIRRCRESSVTREAKCTLFPI